MKFINAPLIDKLTDYKLKLANSLNKQQHLDSVSHLILHLHLITPPPAGPREPCVCWSEECVRCAQSLLTFVFYKYHFTCREMAYAWFLCVHVIYPSGPWCLVDADQVRLIKGAYR